ncbi:MAG: hypothetical protein QXJ27_02345 [Thermoplasmata archaeon]
MSYGGSSFCELRTTPVSDTLEWVRVRSTGIASYEIPCYFRGTFIMVG